MKKVNINGKEYTIREMLATELDECLDLTDKKQSLKKQVIISTGITSDEYDKLSVKERISILTVINKLNSVDDDFLKNLN